MAMSSGCGGVGARAPWAGLWTGEASLESNLALPSQTNYVSMLGLNNSHPGCLVEEILTQVPFEPLKAAPTCPISPTQLSPEC